MDFLVECCQDRELNIFVNDHDLDLSKLKEIIDELWKDQYDVDDMSNIYIHSFDLRKLNDVNYTGTKKTGGMYCTEMTLKLFNLIYENSN